MDKTTANEDRVDVVCMLAEMSYFHGAAALANSLVRNGFQGHIVVGYRGALPKWEGPVQPATGSAQMLSPGVDIKFVEVLQAWHLGNLKPHFMLDVAKDLYPGLTSIWYFDVDIVLKTSWSNFARWCEIGLVLVLDMAETYMPSNHIFRREWAALAARARLSHQRAINGYFNSGCVGVTRRELDFLHAWRTLLEQLAHEGADMTRLVDRSGKPEFAKMDQDILNAAVMATKSPFGVLGVEAMDAFPSAQIMSHAMVFAKPWVRNYIRDAIIGFQPDAAHLAFWRYADKPIASFTPTEWQRKMRVLKVSRLIGHLRRRSLRDW